MSGSEIFANLVALVALIVLGDWIGQIIPDALDTKNPEAGTRGERSVSDDLGANSTQQTRGPHVGPRGTAV